MWDLPRDMEEEVLCRVPLTSVGLVRSTCKRWNMLSRCDDHLFAKKHLAHLAAEAAKKKDHPLVVMMMDYRVQLMRLNLSNNKDEVVVVNPEAKLIGLDQIDVREIFHCDGLLLCIPKEDHYRLIVWNPYWGRGQLRWIEHTHNHHLLDKHLSGCLDMYTYGFGYDNSSSQYKILRFMNYPHVVEFKIYDFNSDSWRILDLFPPDNDWRIKFDQLCLSLKGNTYWFAAEAMNYDAISFLVCFDFTTETFSPPLPLPFEAFPQDTLSLSSSSTSLVVLFQSADTWEMEIWISNTIEQPNALSWNSKVFLSANIEQRIYPHCFFIDQEKKVVVIFDKNAPNGTSSREIAYIFVGGGVDDDGSFLKQQVVKESAYPFCCSHGCYYVPSLVQLN
ncbi:F-box protein [Raphanus sativus]|uniref:F-box protein At3g24580 n=1 Tax=Raphanus sativus TaxID=3726 RepID=A0A6J0MTU1_RAPSA|nr:putative F-box protein At3g24580 [Raphanus sativus]KAJ4908498.1 F-box protein [Raphanus sativus]